MGNSPDAVVGHSVGEVAAAYVAGALSLEDAVLISFHRSRLQQTMAGRGAMLAIGLSERETREHIRKYADLSIAAINSQSAVTVSGAPDSLKSLADTLERNGGLPSQSQSGGSIPQLPDGRFKRGFSLSSKDPRGKPRGI